MTISFLHVRPWLMSTPAGMTSNGVFWMFRRGALREDSSLIQKRRNSLGLDWSHSKGNNKQCQLDPIPTRVVKQCCDLLAPAISAIINNSFTNGEFPNSLKSAIVRPIIKKTNMDPFDLKSWRPISNLSFLSKLVERVAVSRLNEHLWRYNLLPPRQSAYRAHHSTETAVTAVVNDIAQSVDGGQLCALVLLDLLRGLTPIVRLRKEEPGYWSVVIGFSGISMIELLGASKWG